MIIVYKCPHCWADYPTQPLAWGCQCQVRHTIRLLECPLPVAETIWGPLPMGECEE